MFNRTLISLTPTVALDTSSWQLRLASSVAWSLLGSVLARGLTTVASIYSARILGRESFGELQIIRDTVAMATSLGGFGLGITTVKYVAEFRKHDVFQCGSVIGLSLALAASFGSVAAIAIFSLAPWIASDLLAAPALESMLRLASIMLLCSVIDGAQSGILAGLESFRTTAQIHFFSGMASLPLIVGGAYAAGLEGAITGWTAYTFLRVVLNHIAIQSTTKRRQITVTFSGWSQLSEKLFRFSVPAALSTSLAGPIHWASRAILANQPHGYRAIGILGGALIFQTIVLFIGMSLHQPLLAMISSSARADISQLKLFNMLSSWAIGIFLSLPLVCFPEICQICLGTEFSGAEFSGTLSLVLLSTCLILFKQGIAREMAAQGLLWWSFLSNMVWAVALLVGAVFWAPLGAVGVATAGVLSYVVNIGFFIPFYIRRRVIPLKTLVSWEALIIWTVLTTVSLLVVSSATLPVRVFAFLGGTSTIALCLWRMKD